MSYLAIPASFEYLCHGSMVNINCIFNSFGAGTDFRRQILTSKNGLRAERVGIALPYFHLHLCVPR